VDDVQGKPRREDAAAAVVAVAISPAAAIAASPRRRPAFPIARSIASEPTKSTWSFAPGRAPVARSNASKSRVRRSRSFWAS
jgi:hypothetical protein